MHTPKSFDYDLWTKEIDGEKHYFAKVKRTGEVTEISHDVMKFLRSEEKKLKREIAATYDPEKSKVYSYEQVFLEEDEESSDLISTYDLLGDIETLATEEDFRRSLTPYQLRVYEECLLPQKTPTEYAAEQGISRQSLCETINYIRKKAKKFF